ncbi:MAG: UvrD/REP helicase, partial [Acidimicrobiales bacterium]|nr:UvrD/REP helicase [Acidimicrobiales bacterium]
DEVLAGLTHWDVHADVDPESLDERWRELASFAVRYHQALDNDDAVDGPGLLRRAADTLATNPAGYAHVLVDDYEAATTAAARLVDALLQGAAALCVAANPDAAINSGQGAGPAHFEAVRGTEIVLAEPFRRPAPPELVRCGHPSVESEAVAGELLAARDAGVRWSDMAVLVRSPRRRVRAVARALARHAIPVAATEGPLADEPVVGATIDMLRWAAGDESALDRLVSSPLSGLDAADVRALRRQAQKDGVALTDHPRLAGLVGLHDELAARLAVDDPATLAFVVWERALGPPLVASNDPADDRALDAFVAFHGGLSRDVERHPSLRVPQWLRSIEGDGRDRWRVRAATQSADAVTVTSIAAAAGREWHTVVIPGAVEGELPSVHARQPLFDPAALDDTETPTMAERRRLSLAEERRLFCEVGATRATAVLVATAAAEPGTLESRFVGNWAARPPRVPLAPGRPPVVRPPTDGAAPLFPDRSLRLSASQLETYDDCPLRYFYEYVLRVRDDSNVYAELGSLVHATLAAFLDPDGDVDVDYSLDGLRRLGEQLWRDDLARYRPQVEEARRDYFAILEKWWQDEGALAKPDVLAVERDFEVSVGPHRIVGSIDRIDKRHGTLRIVDYKTSTREAPVDAMPDNVQLAVYHLAACRDPDLVACGPATELDLLYVRSMKVRSQPVTADHEAKTEARVLAVADRILAEDFKPSVHANCRVCAFHRLCPIQAAGRETSPDA